MSELNAQYSNHKNNVNLSINNDNVDNKRKRKNNNMDRSTVPKQFKDNYYSVLDCENDTQCDKELLNKYEQHVNNCKEKPQTSHSATTATNNDLKIKNKSNETVVRNDKSKNKKIPPINIVDIDSKQLIEFIKNGLKINDFKIKEFRNKKSLFLNTLEDFLRVKAFLEKTKTKFFTFTPKGIKTKTYILKGLDASVDTEDILNELSKFEDDELKFIKISPFSTKLAIEKGHKLPIFLVQISPESNINKLKNIKAILYRCVKWEHVRRPEIPQCRNCQGFFHSAANCYLPTRCVKCNLDHERGKCSVNMVQPDEKNKLFCVLCNKYRHPASYKGCEKYKNCN